MQVRSLGWEDPLEEGTAPYSSILAQRIPWTEEPAGLWSRGLQRVSDLACVHTVCARPSAPGRHQLPDVSEAGSLTGR